VHRFNDLSAVNISVSQSTSVKSVIQSVTSVEKKLAGVQYVVNVYVNHCGTTTSSNRSRLWSVAANSLAAMLGSS
jgi:hypothetical protein